MNQSKNTYLVPASCQSEEQGPGIAKDSLTSMSDVNMLEEVEGTVQSLSNGVTP